MNTRNMTKNNRKNKFQKLNYEDKLSSKKRINSNNLTQVNDVSPQSSLMKGNQIKRKIHNNTDATEQKNEKENITNNMNITSIKKKKQEEKNMSHISNNTIQCDDVIQKTPGKLNVDIEEGLIIFKKNILLVHTSFSHADLKIIKLFEYAFNIKTQTTWSDNITHLVVNSLPNGELQRTKKYLNALFLGCFIITIDWIKDCLKYKLLLCELDYLPAGQESFQAITYALHIKRGIIDSTLAWTSTFALFFHKSIEMKDLQQDLVFWGNKAGFVVVNNIEELNCDTFSARIILTNVIKSKCKSNLGKLPTNKEIKNWIFKYKAITLHLDWFLDCVYKHEFINLEPKYHVKELNQLEALLLDMPIPEKKKRINV